MAKSESVEKAARQTADAADQATQAATPQADTLLAELQPALDALTHRVHALAEHGKALAADAGHQTRDSVRHARDQAGQHVADKPLQSLAIAAAVGLALGWLISRR